MKTVFITSFHVLISRNILAAGVPARLTAAGSRVVILVPDYKVSYFEEHFGGPNISVAGVKASAPTSSSVGLFFKRLSENMLDTVTVALKQKQRRSLNRRWLSYLFFWLPARWAWRLPGAIGLARALDFKFSPRAPFQELIDRGRPDIIFSTDIQNQNDVAIVQAARRRGIATVGMVRSWDNLTNYLLRVIPDILLVGNDIEREEAIRYHGVPAGIIRVVGIPHYDRYQALARRRRDEFLRSLGLDPGRRLIFYTPIGDRYVPDNNVDGYVFSTLLAAAGDANIIVRFPPADTVAGMDNFGPRPNVYLDRPGVAFGQGEAQHREVGGDDDRLLMEELFHSDVVVTGPSSIAVDAAFFGKPVIMADFYPTPRRRFERVVGYGYAHLGYVLGRGGARVIRSPEELRRWLKAYLDDPGRDAAGRAKVRADLCGPADGRSVERIARLLTGMAG